MIVRNNSVNAHAVVTNSGEKMAKSILRDKATNNAEMTVADTTAAGYMWSRDVGGQYPSILDLPRRTAVASEHLLGLIRSLKI
ncbi:error-prone DNA polymerase [Desulfovibrio ferrophilus]|uniref:Error-prone DNA polymerase n=2 Tax=Desulfovibrio ferrophilus TaxID=241368 RepID=A0A2Z6AW76_9BACT|nr:error-prone DNA polymerase [Desulfovibrio ferrophilus]